MMGMKPRVLPVGAVFPIGAVRDEDGKKRFIAITPVRQWDGLHSVVFDIGVPGGCLKLTNVEAYDMAEALRNAADRCTAFNIERGKERD